jgi:hypothetical protein
MNSITANPAPLEQVGHKRARSHESIYPALVQLQATLNLKCQAIGEALEPPISGIQQPATE